MTKGKRYLFELVPDQSGGGPDQGGQQGQSQSPGPPLMPEGEKYLFGIAPRGLLGTTKLPPLKLGGDKGDGDNPHNPGGRLKH